MFVPRVLQQSLDFQGLNTLFTGFNDERPRPIGDDDGGMKDLSYDPALVIRDAKRNGRFFCETLIFEY